MEVPQKICTKCGQPKSLDEFYAQKGGLYGKSSLCKACVKPYNAARATQPKIVPEEKVCTKCGMTKPIDEFGFDKHTNDGHATRCLLCKCAESEAYRDENPEKVREATAKWAAENPDKIRAYVEANSEKISAQRKARHAANQAKDNAQNAANYAANKDEWRPVRQAWETAHKEERRATKAEQYLLRDPEERRERDRAWVAANPDKVRAHNNRRRARKNNAPVNDLTAEQWKEIQVAFQFRCVYCPTDCKECKKKTHALTQDHVTPYSHNGSNTLWNIVPACLSHNSQKRAGPPLVPVQPLLLTISPSRAPKKKGA